jgi:hypothetical protein
MNRLRDAAALVIARTARAWTQPADEAAARDIATVQVDTSPSCGQHGDCCNFIIQLSLNDETSNH